MDISDKLTAYQFDKAVTTWGNLVENALHERKEVVAGKHKEWRAVYTLEQILEDDFKLPRPPSKRQKQAQGVTSLLALAGNSRSGVKLWTQRAPETSHATNGN